MSGTELALVITASTGLFVALSAAVGKAASYVISLVQSQADATITTLRAEIKTKDERIEMLESKLNGPGVDQ